MKSPISIKRREPPIGPDPDYSRAFYPDPPSHDFNVWLIIAEMMRRYHGAPGPLRVKFGFIDGQLGKVDFGPQSVSSGTVYACNLSREYSDTMLENVLRPAIQMLGAIEERPVEAPFSAKELGRYVEYDYHIGHLVDAARQGYALPKWRAPQWAADEVDEYLDGLRPVIITLRETTAQPERNSNLGEWLRFAAAIEDRYPVLFLRDTAKAHEPLPHRTWPRASENAYVRVALYQRAMVNMLVCNGPCSWLQFSDAPYLMFKQLVPELPFWQHGQPEGWREQDHVEVGEQLPWAGSLQRMTWTDDTFENIRDAFDGFMAARAA